MQQWHNIYHNAIMKKIFIAICCISLLISCSKKTVPSKPNYTLNNNHNNSNSTTNNVTNDSIVTNKVTTDTIAAVSANTIMIVSDGYGRLLTPQQNLPQDAGVKYNSLQLSKGFTAQQLANLQARYHTVPPRVLYVPQQAGLSSLKGNYYIFKKKFWYWKKSDGFYYLDEKYYL
jgi:hypothetical protein